VRIPEFLDYLERGDHAKPIQVRAPHSDRMLSLQIVRYSVGQSLVLTRDVTQFQRLERMRREFVANVSHELRTPLTVVSGFLETLRDEPDPAAASRYIDLMSEQARRMQRLVEDLLTLSALESSPPPPMEEAVDMRALLARLGAEARALSGGRHRIELDAEEGLDLVGSEKELASAFGNLVSNAIRYTPEKGTVRLRWHAPTSGAEFAVETPGIGIPASTSRGSPSASTASTAGARARPAGRAWDWRSSSTRSRATGRSCRFAASRARAAPSARASPARG
jgi:two-component system phosphate regulon sensor histidine kinase PhoR